MAAQRGAQDAWKQLELCEMNPLNVNWHAVFAPTVGLAELFFRGSAMYLGILAFMRILRRQKGALNTADLLVLIIVADAAQNAMSAEYTSLTEGLVLVGTLFLWDYVLDTLSFRYKLVRRILNEPPLPLVKAGRLQRTNMRKEMLTKDDVLAQLREQGIDDLSLVKHCCLESDGHFSVVKFDEETQHALASNAGVR